MILFDEALNIVSSLEYKTGTERVPLFSSLNRILAEEIFSDIDMPPFNKAAVDGYSCRMSDIHDTLRVIGIIPAGVVPPMKIQKRRMRKDYDGSHGP